MGSSPDGRSMGMPPILLGQTLEQEAQEKIARNVRLQEEIKEKIQAYNEAVSGINNCLQSMQVYEHQLSLINEESLQRIL